jgi:hypothetical protein
MKITKRIRRRGEMKKHSRAEQSRMSMIEQQSWIARAIKDLNNDNDKTMTEDQLVEKVMDLIADVPDGLINEVARELSRYAVDKQQQNQKEEISSPVVVESESEDDETGKIQNAYNTLHEMMDSSLEPVQSVLDYFRTWPQTAFEVDKWGWMLLHHMVARRANVRLIEAVAKENPAALSIGVGVAHHTPIQLAARSCRPLEIIKALHEADPRAIRIWAPNGDTAHMLACRAKADMDVRVFLYVNRDGPEEDYADMPDLIPISPPESDDESDDAETETDDAEIVVEQEKEDFISEYVRLVGLKEAYPVLVILLAWITMLTLSLLAGVRMAVA